MRADIHPSNEGRLQTLHSHEILDSPREADFDEIVELASEICGTPISLISLVDEDRQWFKASKGLDATETPFDQSVCAHAILNGDFFEVPDMQADPRTADNPLVTGDENLRFYAGVPLIADNGLPLGTLCVLDRQPLQLNDFQRRALQVLSRQVMKQIELRSALRHQAILQDEADHRVKNSLQSMSAIVRTYARGISDPIAGEAFAAIQRRIDAVAELHSELQGTSGRETLDTVAYLTRVMTLLQDGAPENVTLNWDLAPIIMRADQAANLAMIISEFVANSIKHAFPDQIGGEIGITLDMPDAERCRLTCTDNGVGLGTRDQPSTRTEGIGLRLIQAAASSLGGDSTSELTPDGSSLVLDFVNRLSDNSDHPLSGIAP